MEHRAEYQHQTLRAVDPGAAVEGLAVPPQARDLAVAPFVGGQRSSAEGQAQPDRERAGERWGKAREDLDWPLAAAAAVVLAAALAGAIWLLGLPLTADRWLLVLLGPAVVLRRTRRYLLDFAPFVLLILLYAELRGLAHVARPHPYSTPQLEAERFLFGGVVPSQELQQALFAGHLRPFDRVVVTVTRIHSLVPALLAFALWLRRRALFYRFAATFLALSFASAIVFLVYPAAPPWATVSGLARIGRAATTAGDDNPYAAIPSLHGGYAFLVFLFVATLAWRTRWRWWALGLGILYPLAQSFAAVYTGNHYVVDLLIGDAAATAAFYGVRRFWRLRGLPG